MIWFYTRTDEREFMQMQTREYEVLSLNPNNPADLLGKAGNTPPADKKSLKQILNAKATDGWIFDGFWGNQMILSRPLPQNK
jgi:hypothetical protein